MTGSGSSHSSAVTFAARPLSQPKRIYFAYAAPATVLAMISVVVFVYLQKYYTDEIGIDLNVLGGLVLVSRVWDAVLDPTIGRLSDRTRTRFGRRRPWLLAAMLPFVAVYVLLSHPPAALANAWGIGALLISFFILWSMLSVPLEAWGSELVFDFQERNRLFGIRDGGVVFGTVLASLVPWALSYLPGGQPGHVSGRELQQVGWIFSVLMVSAVCIALRTVPDGLRQHDSAPPLPIGESLRQSLSNRPFRILLLSYTVSGIGAALPATLLLYYVQYILGAPDAAPYLFLYFVVGFAVIPLWIRAANVFGKKEAWMAAITVNTGAFVGVLFLGRGDTALYTACVAGSALGYGGTMILPGSMQADVIDFDELQTGRRREGELLGLWSVAKKITQAFGAAIAFPILYATGYVPNGEQSDLTKSALVALYGGVPVVCNLAALVIARRYPISAAEYERIRAAHLTRLTPSE